MLLFCFKQKTAYEMRISDWSSDVCSSDLGLEYDDYDSQASHCLLRDRCGKRALGTVRVVMTTGADTGVDSLPLAEYASEESMEILRSLPGASKVGSATCGDRECRNVEISVVAV